MNLKRETYGNFWEMVFIQCTTDAPAFDNKNVKTQFSFLNLLTVILLIKDLKPFSNHAEV